MKSYILPFAALFVSTVSFAFPQCAKPSQTVFHCTTTKGKIIEVCDSGKTIDYAFGKPDVAPEIIVKAPRKSASTYQWQGIGRTISYAVDVPNGKTTYSVYWAFEKPMEENDEPEPEGGVAVLANGKTLATVTCDPKKEIVQRIEGIDLRPTSED